MSSFFKEQQTVYVIQYPHIHTPDMTLYNMIQEGQLQVETGIITKVGRKYKGMHKIDVQLNPMTTITCATHDPQIGRQIHVPITKPYYKMYRTQEAAEQDLNAICMRIDIQQYMQNLHTKPAYIIKELYQTLRRIDHSFKP